MECFIALHPTLIELGASEGPRYRGVEDQDARPEWNMFNGCRVTEYVEGLVPGRECGCKLIHYSARNADKLGFDTPCVERDIAHRASRIGNSGVRYTGCNFES